MSKYMISMILIVDTKDKSPLDIPKDLEQNANAEVKYFEAKKVEEKK